VTDTLEKASYATSEGIEAHRIASEVKAAVKEPRPKPSRLKQLVMSAITAGTTELGQDAATELVHLGSPALQTFRPTVFCQRLVGSAVVANRKRA
jgi:hypothetical protein